MTAPPERLDPERLEPERLDHFMARANAAYYATRDPFADFTTAPEIAQMFGELLGAWAAVCWQAMGRPDPVLLVEAGPGRGTLMADVLRAVSQVAPDFRAALRLHLIETSPRLRAIQAEALPMAAWHPALEHVPDGPTLLLANEFLDALPIRQFVRRGKAWTERWVAGGAFLERPVSADSHRLEPPAAPSLVQGHRPRPPFDAPATVQECNEAAVLWVTRLAGRLATQGGAALLLDYGPARGAPGESLQALRDGHPADPLADPGASDLTAHVDFEALSMAARSQSASVYGPIPQGALLERLGLYARAGRLARSLPARPAAALMQAAQRLAQPDRMGALFKALAICHPALPAPPGFES